MEIEELETVLEKLKVKGAEKNVVVKTLAGKLLTQKQAGNLSPILGKVIEYGKKYEYSPWYLTLGKTWLTGKYWPTSTTGDVYNLQNDTIVSIEIFEDVLFKAKGSPIFWKGKAEELNYAGNVLLKDIRAKSKNVTKKLKDDVSIEFALKELTPNTMFIVDSLYGFSIEALIKGICIKQKPDAYLENGKLKKIATHDLKKLAKIAGIELSKTEQIFCERAMFAMLNEARYPIPLYSNEISTSALKSTMMIGSFYDIYESLYHRLYNTISSNDLT